MVEPVITIDGRPSEEVDLKPDTQIKFVVTGAPPPKEMVWRAPEGGRLQVGPDGTLQLKGDSGKTYAVTFNGMGVNLRDRSIIFPE